ncbi:MAG: hypothetical protein UHW86_04845, partial [Spirochaetota bacterium]|nr:hypothetical protein [Spirochaetota bacterium]
MKKLLINIVCFFVTFSVFAQNTDAVLPEILLPEIDINIQDMKEIHVDTLEDSGEFLNIELDPLVKPEITQSIKVDLEKTLPARLDEPDRKKPVDAQIKFGYGANNNMMADFVGEKEGFSAKDFDDNKKLVAKAYNVVKSERGTGMMGWTELPYN